MCRRRDSIAEQNAAARALARACIARRTYVVLHADLLRDPAAVKCLPEKPGDFDDLLRQLDRKDGDEHRH